MKITKLVLPVAGLGKRLRPLTLRMPKNLLKMNGRPLLEYVLEEGRLSGIKEVILVVNPANKKHFQEYLRLNSKKFPFKFHLRIQETPAGNGHALLSAYDILKNEPFAVRFCDDIILAEEPVISSLIKCFNFYHSAVVLLEKVPRQNVSRYGVVGIRKASQRPGKSLGGKIYRITEIVEKPKASLAPSNLIIIGGYVLTPSILRNLKKVSDSLPQLAADALPLAVGLQIELIVGGKIYGWEFAGKRLDCGTLKSFRQTEEILRQSADKLTFL